MSSYSRRPWFDGLVGIAFLGVTLAACGDDGPPGGPVPGSEADMHGVGASCEKSDDCKEEGQECLTEFSGGYCGIEGCQNDGDCPNGSACVALAGKHYCFLVCVDKVDCNRNRPVDAESNCSANVDFTDGRRGRKACVPPSGS